MARQQPAQQAPPVQRLRIRYAKRGRLRFASHRDFARAFERALRRAGVPMAYSSGFSPHPRISYANAAPTGAASEAEYLEIALVRECDPAAVRDALDASLPAGLDVLDAVPARAGALADRLTGSRWRIEVSGVDEETLRDAVTAFLAADEVAVERMMKSGLRRFDARDAGAGTVYPVLARLRNAGLVQTSWRESPHGPPRKYYRLTAAGERAYIDLARAWRHLAGAMAALLDDTTDRTEPDD